MSDMLSNDAYMLQSCIIVAIDQVVVYRVTFLRHNAVTTLLINDHVVV